MITTAVGSGGNFFVTAKDPSGPWTDPIWIKEANGIDPSLYWDENGDCWYTGAGRLSGPRWADENRIYIAKLDTKTGRLLTPMKEICSGHANNAKWTEGPHLFRFNDKYVLMVAEGGTAEMHAITIHQSDTINGTYHAHQINPALTHRHLGDNHPINTIGHADMVETHNGEWWAVTLGKRPNVGHLLARETFLTPVSIENGVPVFNPGVGRVLESDRRPNLPWVPTPSPYGRDEFDKDVLGAEYCCVRTPTSEWWRIKGGSLLLQYNKESFTDFGNPSFWGRRIEAHNFTVATSLETHRLRSNEEAGLLAYRTKESFISLMHKGNEVVVTLAQKGNAPIEVARTKYKGSKITLKLEAKDGEIQAYYGEDESTLLPLGIPQPLRILGDDVNGRFNGPFVGIATSANGKETKQQAQFNWFEYKQ